MSELKWTYKAVKKSRTDRMTSLLEEGVFTQRIEPHMRVLTVVVLAAAIAGL